MPRVIDPATWDEYIGYLATGWSKEQAASKAGVSVNAARDFLAGNSASARRWRELTAGPCPLCGCDERHDDENG